MRSTRRWPLPPVLVGGRTPAQRDGRAEAGRVLARLRPLWLRPRAQEPVQRRQRPDAMAARQGLRGAREQPRQLHRDLTVDVDHDEPRPPRGAHRTRRQQHEQLQRRLQATPVVARARQFQALGYRYLHLGSWWNPTRFDRRPIATTTPWGERLHVRAVHHERVAARGQGAAPRGAAAVRAHQAHQAQHVRARPARPAARRARPEVRPRPTSSCRTRRTCSTATAGR